MVFEMSLISLVSVVFILNVKYTSVSVGQFGIISKISKAYRFKPNDFMKFDSFHV